MRRFKEAGVLSLLVLVVIAATIKEPRFLDPKSIGSILLLIPLILIVAVGEMVVIITKGIDISVGSILGVSGIAIGLLFKAKPDFNVYLGLVLAILVGIVLGLVNGLLVTKAKIPAIITTLGTFTAYRGLAFIISHGDQIDANHVPDAVTRWTSEGPFAIKDITFSWLFMIALVVALGMFVFLKTTVAGRSIYAIGSNEHAARVQGIPVNRMTTVAYVISGAVSGLAGILYMSRYGFVNPSTAGGQGFELTVIAAAVIGGTNVSGGVGTVPGVFLGCLLLSCINVALAVLGIAETWQTAVYGAVIIVGLLMDSAVSRRLSRSAA